MEVHAPLAHRVTLDQMQGFAWLALQALLKQPLDLRIAIRAHLHSPRVPQVPVLQIVHATAALAS